MSPSTRFYRNGKILFCPKITYCCLNYSWTVANIVSKFDSISYFVFVGVLGEYSFKVEISYRVKGRIKIGDKFLNSSDLGWFTVQFSMCQSL